jgi:alanyl-tRNA synthetase
MLANMSKALTGNQLRELYLGFFKDKGHAVISGSSIVPQNDPTVLFTTAGMHPLVPYLLGEHHPSGKRLCDCQKCIRTGDIDSVGDVSHLTFFEMLGNWSLGDYFKEEAIAWSYEFLTSPDYLAFSPEQLSVTVFQGNDLVPCDETSVSAWKKMGMDDSHIYRLPIEDNWWGPAGKTGPCGPDTEMFVDTGKASCGQACRPGCSCGKYFEVWNDVFMQFDKTATGQYVPLKQHNVDTGMGLERTTAMLQGKASVYDTELFAPTLAMIARLSGRQANQDQQTAMAFRVVADHMRSSVFILGDEQGVVPSNLGQGYVLRRLIRRAVRFGRDLGLSTGFTSQIAQTVIDQYQTVYPDLHRNGERIVRELAGEEEKFEKTLDRGIAEFKKVIEQMKAHQQLTLPGRVAFKLYDTYGFPVEFTEELCREDGMTVDRDGFDKAFDKHRELSKQGAEKTFKGGLVDNSEATTALHTVTHMLHAALRTVLGQDAKQKGSNITAERLRFDFSYPTKMTPEQVKQVEDIVNDAIARKLPVTFEVMTLEQARQAGAMALFAAKYDEQVKVYTIEGFSKEVCGGPHVKTTENMGHFRIVKEEACSAGVRRIRAVLE